MADDEARFSELPDGSLRGPDGSVYRRTPTRLKRRLSSELVASAPIITNVYPEEMIWHEGSGATTHWHEINPGLSRANFRLARDLQWVGHLWETDAGAPLLVFEGEH